MSSSACWSAAPSAGQPPLPAPAPTRRASRWRPVPPLEARFKRLGARLAELRDWRGFRGRPQARAAGCRHRGPGRRRGQRGGRPGSPPPSAGQGVEVTGRRRRQPRTVGPLPRRLGSHPRAPGGLAVTPRRRTRQQPGDPYRPVRTARDTPRPSRPAGRPRRPARDPRSRPGPVAPGVAGPPRSSGGRRPAFRRHPPPPPGTDRSTRPGNRRGQARAGRGGPPAVSRGDAGDQACRTGQGSAASLARTGPSPQGRGAGAVA